MKIEKGTAIGAGEYWTVKVEKDELLCTGGKLLPYAFTIGTITRGKDNKPKINVWMPASYTPRGYKPSAKLMLDLAAIELQKRDWRVQGPWST